MIKEFLRNALQGYSKYGTEEFLLKFVVRISQCPILMEFDGRMTRHDPNESWSHNIKLVSVTGIDFASRIDDVYHVRDFYVKDFYVKENTSPGQPDQKLLVRDLFRMARLRLRACDLKEVQIVAETDIDLGVFAGKYIGIDDIVRRLSAYTARKVLEGDGPII